jgi:hypothetical protein
MKVEVAVVIVAEDVDHLSVAVKEDVMEATGVVVILIMEIEDADLRCNLLELI